MRLRPSASCLQACRVRARPTPPTARPRRRRRTTTTRASPFSQIRPTAGCRNGTLRVTARAPRSVSPPTRLRRASLGEDRARRLNAPGPPRAARGPTIRPPPKWRSQANLPLKRSLSPAFLDLNLLSNSQSRGTRFNLRRRLPPVRLDHRGRP